jgi:hypothetical protein
MDKPDRVPDHDVGSVRAIAVERVDDPIEFAPLYRPPIEA